MESTSVSDRTESYSNWLHFEKQTKQQQQQTTKNPLHLICRCPCEVAVRHKGTISPTFTKRASWTATADVARALSFSVGLPDFKP